MLALSLTEFHYHLHDEGRVWLLILTLSQLEHPEFRLVDPAVRLAKWTRELTTAIDPEWTAIQLKQALGTRSLPGPSPFGCSDLGKLRLASPGR